MKTSLQEKLFQKYPKIFKNKDSDPKESPMSWGITCGDGWFNIVDSLCHTIQTHCDRTGTQVHAEQVKEKFGGLCFYVDNNIDRYVAGAISAANRISGVTCDVCGAPGDKNYSGWIKTRCVAHTKILKKEPESLDQIAGPACHYCECCECDPCDCH